MKGDDYFDGGRGRKPWSDEVWHSLIWASAVAFVGGSLIWAVALYYLVITKTAMEAGLEQQYIPNHGSVWAKPKD